MPAARAAAAREERAQRQAGRVIAAAATRWLRRRQARRRVEGEWAAILGGVDVDKLILGTGRLPSAHDTQRLCAAAVRLGYDAKRAELLTKILNASVVKPRALNWLLHAHAKNTAFWDGTARRALLMVVDYAFAAGTAVLHRKFALTFLGRVAGFAGKIPGRAGVLRWLGEAVAEGVERVYRAEEGVGFEPTNPTGHRHVNPSTSGDVVCGGPPPAPVPPDALVDDPHVAKLLRHLLDTAALRHAPAAYIRAVFFGAGRAEVAGWALGDAPAVDGFWAEVLVLNAPADATPAALALWDAAWGGAAATGVGPVHRALGAAELEDPRLAAVEALHTLALLARRTLIGATPASSDAWATRAARPWTAVASALLARAPPRSILNEYFTERPEVEELLAALLHRTPPGGDPAVADAARARAQALLPDALIACGAAVAVKYDMFYDRSRAERPPPPPSAADKRALRRKRQREREAARVAELAAARDAVKTAAAAAAAAAKELAAVSAQQAAARGAVGEAEAAARAGVIAEEASVRATAIDVPSEGLRQRAAEIARAARAAADSRVAVQHTEYATRQGIAAAAAAGWGELMGAPFGAYCAGRREARDVVELDEHRGRRRLAAAAAAAGDALLAVQLRLRGAGGAMGGAGASGSTDGHAPLPLLPTTVGDRQLLIIDGLARASDKVNNAALRKDFEPLGAVGVGVIVLQGRRTGRAVVEFNTATRLRAAMTHLTGATVCGSKVTLRVCTDDDFVGLPDVWRKGRPTEVAHPAGAGTPGAGGPSRVAVVHAERCRFDKCARECQRACSYSAISFSQQPVRGVARVVGVVDEARCTGCNLCVKKRVAKAAVRGCPFNAIAIVRVPRELTDQLVNRYGRNGFALCRLPVLKPNKVLGLVGENGAGKSTVLKILAGKLRPNGGGGGAGARGAAGTVDSKNNNNKNDADPTAGSSSSAAALLMSSYPVGIVGPTAPPAASEVGEAGAPLLAGSGDAAGARAPWPDAVKAKFKGTELHRFITRLEGGGVRPAYKPQHVDRLARAVGARGPVAVEEYLACDAADPAKVTRVLDALEIGPPLLRRSLDALSGGEMQRVAVAAVVLRDADVYLFDEPSSFLDVKQRLRVCEVIRDAAAAPGAYAVCVEHDLAVCDYLTDAVAVLHGTAGAFGVVSRPMNVRDGINAFLEGYLPGENTRIRPHTLDFRMHDADDAATAQPAARRAALDAIAYPAATVHRGGGSFRVTLAAGVLRRGEVTAFLGENGCGKSTVLELLAGVRGAGAPAAGAAAPFVPATARLKPQLPVLPDEHATVADVVAAALRGVPEASRRWEVYHAEVLQPLKIDDLRVLEVANLSGGELHRVALAAALCADADLLLIDEPSAFLDAEQRMAAARAIRRVARLLEKAVVLVEHDLMMTSYVADAVVVFEGVPGTRTVASAAEPVAAGMNRFLRQLDVTVRVDAVTHRPRFNKRGSVLDREQRTRGEFYAHAAPIDTVQADACVCPVCDFVAAEPAAACPRCGVRLGDTDVEA